MAAFDLRESLMRNLVGRISNLNLKFFMASEYEAVLLACDHALLFVEHFDYVRTELLLDEKLASPRSHSADSLFSSRASMRAFQPSIVVASRFDALEESVQSLSLALLETCQDILRGDFSWLRQHIAKDPVGRRGRPVSQSVAAIVHARQPCALNPEVIR